MAVVVITLWLHGLSKHGPMGEMNQRRTAWTPKHQNTYKRNFTHPSTLCVVVVGVVKRIHGLSLVHEKVTITLRARGQSENTANALGSFHGGGNWPFTLYEEPKSSGKAGKCDLF